MNEGWASFWHKRILESLELPQELHLEFLIRHTQVLRPSPGSLNPYHVGMKVWEDIEQRWDHPSAEDLESFGPRKKTGREKLFEVREVERDASFLRRYLTEDLIRKLNLFEYKSRGNEQVVSRVADEDNWRQIKETLIQNVGTGTIPVIKVEDADYNNNRALLLKHGRCEAERARAGNNQNRHRVEQRIRQWRRRPNKRPDDKRHHSDQHHRGHKITGDNIGELLNRRATALRFRHHPNNLRQQGIAADALGAHGNGSQPTRRRSSSPCQ